MSRSDVPPLDELLCFDLYAASRALTGRYRALLGDTGLTYPQYLVLVVLWQEGTRTVKQLSEVLHLEYGTLTPLLQRLEANHVVTRDRRRDDERSVLIGLTPTGEALRVRCVNIQNDVRSSTGLCAEEARDLQQTLRRLTANVRGSHKCEVAVAQTAPARR